MSLVESFSGIRGIYSEDLTDQIITNYANSYLTLIKQRVSKPILIIGRDTRPSGEKIFRLITSSLDCDFIDVGVAPTPAIELAVKHFNADGGIIITGSHNEPEYNGFKFLNNDGSILNETDANKVISGSKSQAPKNEKNNTVQNKNQELLDSYKNFLFNLVGKENIQLIKNSNQNIVIDPNGGTGAITKEILKSLNVKTKAINMEQAKFARLVEPNKDSLKYLISEIKNNNADFAAGFDCDADRVEILLKNGNILSGNEILALVVDEFLSNSKKAEEQSVVVNDATSNLVKNIAEKHKAKLIEVEVGETNLVEKMREQNSIIGGEGSNGGIIIPPSKCRDGILTILLMLLIIAKNNKPLEHIVEDLPKYYTARTKLKFDPNKHDHIKKSIKSHYVNLNLPIQELGGITGGLKIRFQPDDYLWFRASKTEPNALRVITDSTNKERAEELLNEGISLISKFS